MSEFDDIPSYSSGNAMVDSVDRYEREMAPIWNEDEQRTNDILKMCEKGTAKISDLQGEIRSYVIFCDENNLKFEPDEMFELIMNYNW